MLYLSEFFEKNKTLYYDNLNFVRTKNDLAQWIKFFLTGVIQTAETGVATLQKIIQLKSSTEREKVLRMGKRARQGSALLHSLFSKPVVTVKDVHILTGLSPKASNDLVQLFVTEGILKEITGYLRNRVFVFDEYVRLFR